MKIGFFYDYSDSGTERVVVPIAKAMRAAGHEIAVQVVDKGRALPPGFDRSLADLDYAHFWNLQTAGLLAPTTVPPFGFTVHGLIPGAEAGYATFIHHFRPAWVHAIDLHTHIQLGRMEIISTLIPQCIDTDGLHHLPYPEEFTLGYLGGDRQGKRFGVVEEIARSLGVPCVGWDGDGVSKPWLSRAEVLDLYAKMSVFVCASFCDGGPIPPQEALLCGRPVVTTRVGQMPSLLEPGVDGEFFDGSVEDGCRAVERVWAEWEVYSAFARDWRPPFSHRPTSVARAFLRQIEESQA